MQYIINAAIRATKNSERPRFERDGGEGNGKPDDACSTPEGRGPASCHATGFGDPSWI